MAVSREIENRYAAIRATEQAARYALCDARALVDEERHSLPMFDQITAQLSNESFRPLDV